VSPSGAKPSDTIRTKHCAPFYSTIQYLDLELIANIWTAGIQHAPGVLTSCPW